MTYAEKLKDPRWQRKRLELLQDKNWRCEDCDDEKANLQIHHMGYLRAAAPWEYPNEMLRVLCEKCHGERQEIEDKIRIALAHIFRSTPTERLLLIYRRLEAMAMLELGL